VRRAELDTTADLGPYLGVPVADLLPRPTTPPRIEHNSVLKRRHGRVIEVLHWESLHVPLSPRYVRRHEAEYACNRHATARWMHPLTGPRRKALVSVHGWLEPGPWFEETLFLPRVYDELGVDVLHVQLPFHGTRKPRNALFHGEFFLTADLVRSIEALRQSCIDARTIVAWLRGQGYTEVGVTGLSFGGSIAMLLACLDPTPDYIVPIVGHLKLGEAVEDAPILWRMKADLERFGVGRDRRQEIFRRLGLDRLRPLLPLDRQLWIMAKDDVYIAAHLVEAQWREWGRPPIEWIPGGHMTFPLSMGKIVEAMRKFHAGLR
jgi:dienelactone hydrolase